MPTLLLTHPDCLLHDMGEGHPERPDRLRAIADALSASAFNALKREQAPSADLAVIERVHPARYVEAIAGTGAAILDTRKTTPGLRELEKAAVLAGGGRNHRMGLYDAILIKENHIALAGSLAKAVYGARSKYPDLAVEVETRNLDEVAYALGTGADILLLDNMDLETLRGAVRLRDENAAGKGPSLEASGGVNLETVRGIAETGVDLISIGALTHSAPTLDFSMLIELA